MATESRTRGAFSPVIAIDRRSSRPVHRQVYEGYRAAIVERRLEPGQRIPSTRELALELGISRMPVLGAYAQLLAEGYFESRVGAGTFISNSLPEQLTSCVSIGAETAKAIAKGPIVSQPDRPAPLREWVLWGYGPGPFSIGQLAFDHFPFDIWSKLLIRRARNVRASPFNYGNPMGSNDFRETLAMYLRTARAVECDASQIMIVSGSQQALDISARALLGAGSAVWIEEPGYELMRQALTLAGCRLIPVPVDTEGLDVAAGKKRCRAARAAYVTPSHQYPLGVTMSASRRLQLLEWAHNAGAWILEDDYDSEYRYESMPIASLQGLDHGRRVVYIGTFSKTLFPALRVGYIVIPRALIERFVAVRRAIDLCAPQLNQAILNEFIDEGHFARHVRKTRLLYKERRSALVSALQTEFGERVTVMGSEAGMHLVAGLPADTADREIAVRAAKAKLWLWPLSSAYLGKDVRRGFILGFGSATKEDIPRAVRRMRNMVMEGGAG